MIELSDLIGQPFDLEGVQGHNCYTLCREVARRAGITLPAKQPIVDLCERSNTIELNKSSYIRLSKPEPFCLAVFKLHPQFVTHIAIMLDSNRFIHVVKKKGVCIESVNNPFWRRHLDGYFRYPIAIGEQPV